jgi:uncharacterized protein with HEPN domain
MPRRELIVMLADAREAVIEAETLLADIETFDAFSASNLHQRALERMMEIAGESSFQARKIQADLPITDLHKIIGLRHMIAHDYYHVSIERLWTIATENLPLLKEEIESCITQENQKLFGNINSSLDE